MKILVTGATGFIGSRLGSVLPPSDDVYALVRTSFPAGTAWNPSTIHGSLDAPAKAFREIRRVKPDVCIHLAWEGIPDFSYEMSRRNLDQSVRLIRFLVDECGCRRLVVGGSCFEYGRCNGPCREDDHATAYSYFAWAKHAICDLGLMLAATQGVSFAWLRFFYVYGPGQRGASLVPALATSLLKGESPAVKTPHNAHDFIYVDDVASAIAVAAHRDVPSGVYNIGTGKSVPIWRVCQLLELAIGRESGCFQEQGAPTGSTSVDFWADTRKTESTLGWTARTSIEQGVAAYLDYLRGTQA